LIFRSKHAAAGMKYLEEQKIIHRDLALRNLLVTVYGESNQYLVKVSDFGLSRIIEGEKEYYKSESNTIPIKWSSPEVLKYNRYSFKSDV